MGGDHAPVAILEGAREALTAHPDLFLHLVGDEARMTPILKQMGMARGTHRAHPDRPCRRAW